WGGRLIRSWDEGWWDAPERVGERIAPLLGAAPGQVVVADSTSVDLFKALTAAVRLNPGRGEILVDAGTFPTDGYLADQVARRARVPLRRRASAGRVRSAAVRLGRARRPVRDGTGFPPRYRDFARPHGDAGHPVAARARRRTRRLDGRGPRRPARERPGTGRF